MNEFEYSAFISYRHVERDTLVAKRVQNGLERFHLPKSIQNKYGISGFKRVFRDEAELEITSDLAGKIDHALEASEFLIVICSPEYKESKWCLHEIDVFLQTHDADHVFCILSSGEPPAVFPDVLLKREIKETMDGIERTIQTDVEPLACDFRGDLKKAVRIELPRLISGMIGCSYDELMLRQESYRRRRFITIASIIGTLALLAILYLVWSNIRINANFRLAQKNESITLSKEALEHYEDRDFYHAIVYPQDCRFRAAVC